MSTAATPQPWPLRRGAVRPESHDPGWRRPALLVARVSRRPRPQTRLARLATFNTLRWLGIALRALVPAALPAGRANMRCPTGTQRTPLPTFVLHARVGRRPVETSLSSGLQRAHPLAGSALEERAFDRFPTRCPQVCPHRLILLSRIGRFAGRKRYRYRDSKPS